MSKYLYHLHNILYYTTLSFFSYRLTRLMSFNKWFLYNWHLFPLMFEQWILVNLSVFNEFAIRTQRIDKLLTLETDIFVDKCNDILSTGTDNICKYVWSTYLFTIKIVENDNDSFIIVSWFLTNYTHSFTYCLIRYALKI